MAMFDIGKRGSQPREEPEEPMDGLDTVFGDKERPQTPERPAPEQSPVRRREAAVIGPSIHIEGTLRGEEDLVIEGHVKGAVRLQGNSLTIGTQGKVEADLHARTIHVDGTVEGDLFGSELVAIRKTAQIRGNITAPRVSLEDGARFRGAIDMDTRQESGSKPAEAAKSPAPSSGANQSKPAAQGASGSAKPSTGDSKSGTTGA